MRSFHDQQPGVGGQAIAVESAERKKGQPDDGLHINSATKTRCMRLHSMLFCTLPLGLSSVCYSPLACTAGSGPKALIHRSAAQVSALGKLQNMHMCAVYVPCMD